MPSKPSKTVRSSATPTLQGLARLGYFYLATFLGLVTFAVGSVCLLNVLLDAYVLPPVANVYDITDALSSTLRSQYGPSYVETGPVTKTLSMVDAKAAVAQADTRIATYSTTDVPSRNSALSLSIVLMLIGGVIYFWHRREIFKKMQKVESKKQS